MSQTSNRIRWGMLSAARIGAKVWDAIRLSGNGVVAAVASRDASKAEAFVDEHQRRRPFESRPRALGSYEALLEAKDIDAVYIPLPTAIRAPWVVAAAKAGKHVVCEKPCASSAEELRGMLQACERAGVQFMDGVMFMHGARLGRLRAALDDGSSVGELRRVTSAFSFLGNERFLQEDIRLDPALEPFGCLGDLGWYCLRFTLWAGNWRLPKAVTGRLLRAARRRGAAGDVPMAFSGELLFDGWSAGFHCSFEGALQQWAHVDGTLGGVRVDDFVLPTHGDRSQFWAAGQSVACDQPADPHAEGQATRLYRRFAELVLSGRPDSFWPEISLKTQRVLDACLRASKSGAPVNL